MPQTNEFQLTLAPIPVVNLMPKHDQSADCQTYCEASDGHQYAVKQTTDSSVFPFTPFDELFCYDLAKLCGIAVPQYNLLTMPDGSVAFGSVWEASVVANGFASVFNDVMGGGNTFISKQKFIERLSAVYAFDLFVHNEDRHFGNYLVRPTFNSYVMIAMDFSRAWTNLDCPIDRTRNTMKPPYLPEVYISPPHQAKDHGQDSNTKQCARLIWSENNLGPISGGFFFRTLNSLLAISEQQIQSILNRAPDEWCDSARKQEILAWWLSEEKNRRINMIKGAYQNGALV